MYTATRVVVGRVNSFVGRVCTELTVERVFTLSSTYRSIGNIVHVENVVTCKHIDLIISKLPAKCSGGFFFFFLAIFRSEIIEK